MKLSILSSTSARRPAEARDSARQRPEEAVRRVEGGEGLDGERRRSLGQELAELDPRAAAPFAGREQVLQGARRVAAQLVLLGSNAGGLVRLRALSAARPRIDDEA